MKKASVLLIALVLLCIAMAGCTNTNGSPGQTLSSSAPAAHYPVTIENNGITSVYKSAPERVVVLSYSQAEIMTALGIQDKIIALTPNMNRIEEVLPEYRDVIESLPVFEKSGMSEYMVPNLEAVLSVNPDFVWGTTYSFRAGNCGAQEDYTANGINMYASEGTCVETPTLENLYNDIQNIGKIFDIEDKASALIDQLRIRETAVANTVTGNEKVSVFTLDYMKRARIAPPEARPY